MALFPEVNESYLSEKDRFLKSKMSDFYTQSLSINQAFWNEADIDTRFEAGDQDIWDTIYGGVTPKNARKFNFNRIRRIVNVISGYQRKNRKSMVAIPIENADQKTADQYSKLLMWVAKNDSILETISESFEGAIVTGLNFLHVFVDYRNDPKSGDIKVNNCPYNSFLVDPFFRKPDLSDCNQIWKRSYHSKKVCMSLYPQYSEIIAKVPMESGIHDDKFEFMPESRLYPNKDLLAVDEFYYRSFRKQKILVDTLTGETLEWKGKEVNRIGQTSDEALADFLSFYPNVTVIEKEVPTVNLAVLVQGIVVYDGLQPLGIDTYPMVPVFAYYRPQMPYFASRIQGIVRGLRDPQYLYNRLKVLELDIIESQTNSGWIVKENALVNPKDVYMAGQGRALFVKQEAQMADVQKINPAMVPPTTIELSRLLGQEVQEISGVNEELLGSASDDKAGILSMLRQGAGLTT